MVEVPVRKLKLRDNKDLISPPSVVFPLYQCAKSVMIVNFIPNAKLDLQVDGMEVIVGAPGGFPVPNGRTLLIPAALVIGQEVRLPAFWRRNQQLVISSNCSRSHNRLSYWSAAS